MIVRHLARDAASSQRRSAASASRLSPDTAKFHLNDRIDLLARVASLYYEENLTQAEIARRAKVSRSTISRLLDEARGAGVVEVIIHYPWKSDPELERMLKSRFRLEHVCVLAGRGRPYEEILRGLGVLAARYMEGLIKEDTVLGISWGTAVYSVAQALRPERRLPITVVQMIGAVGTGDPLIDGPDLARLLANIFGGEYRCLHAPLIVENAEMRNALLQEPRIRETLSASCGANLALVGIGSVVPEFSSLLRAGYVDRKSLSQLRAQGAVGDICARNYDTMGQVMDIDLNQRVVGIGLEDLHKIPRVIGVAGGKAKAEAILGALRGGHVNVLVTDDSAAEKVLASEGVA
jgi:deoxyribonucleoside regulator